MAGRQQTLGGNETLLLVEDEPAVRSLIRRTLERHGYVVLDAGDAADAIEIARVHVGRIDLLVCDVVLAGVRAEAVVHAIRGIRPGLRVLYVSGYPRDDLGVGEAFLQKPFSIADLAEKVRAILDG